jgi:hypothetical protein
MQIVKLNWFDATEAQKFGNTLAHFLIERLPLNSEKKKDKTIEKQQEVVLKLFAQIVNFKKNNSLNLYKKAKLGNAFKWELKQAGYDDEFINQLTHEIMLKL